MQLAGLPVIAAAAASDLSSSRYWLTLAGLARGGAGAARWSIVRSARALVPLVPIVLATGWSSLVLWLIGIPLNPMSAALGALTIAIATEFSVILAARFHEERGGAPGSGRRCGGLRAHRRGRARLGVTAIAGFAVLIASEVRMLRDFGVVTVIDLSRRPARGDARPARRPGLVGGAMRDRYSIVVGLLFLAIIVVATINTLERRRGRGRWGSTAAGALAAAGVRGAGRRRRARRRRQRRPGRLRNLAVPCPADARRTPACRIRTAGAIRVCDLFDRPLVISFWFTKGGDCADQQDVVERVYRRYRGRVNFLSLDMRDDRDTVRELIRQHGWKMPVGYDRDGAVGCLYRVAAARPSPTPTPAGRCRAPASATSPPASSSAGSSGCCRDPAAEAELRWPRAARAEGWVPAPRQGWVAPHVAAEFPGLGIAWVEVDGSPGEPGVGARAGCGASRTASTAPTPCRCASSRSPGPTGSSSARSASTPTAPALRSSSSPSSGSTTGLHQPGPARRRADDRDRRDRRGPARLRRRPGRRASSASATRRRASR